MTQTRPVADLIRAQLKFPLYVSAKVCKQSATEHDQPVCKCLQYIISRCNLFQSSLVRVPTPPPHPPPPPPPHPPSDQSSRLRRTALPIRLGRGFITIGSNVDVKSAYRVYILSSLINLISEAGIKGASIKDERIMYLICYI